jgi:hypothetical protein
MFMLPNYEFLYTNDEVSYDYCFGEAVKINFMSYRQSRGESLGSKKSASTAINTTRSRNESLELSNYVRLCV